MKGFVKQMLDMDIYEGCIMLHEYTNAYWKTLTLLYEYPGKILLIDHDAWIAQFAQLLLSHGVFELYNLGPNRIYQLRDQ